MPRLVDRLISILLLALPATAVKAQDIQQKFINYQEDNLQEKLFLHTDRPGYLAGEICWFKVYAVDAFFHRPINISKLAYVEILDTANKPVLQAKIALNDGSGSGSFQLPFPMATGHYRLRAYTNWMKNFSPSFYFNKILTVINTRSAFPAVALTPGQQYDLHFFPEGGAMVNGLKTKLGFKLAGSDGRGIDCSGVLVNEKGDTVNSFSTLQFGMGNVDFTPMPGHSYKGIVVLAGGTRIEQALPAAAASGYTMHTDIVTGQLKVLVRATTDMQQAGNVYFLAHTRGALKMAQSRPLQDGSVEFLMDRNKLGAGISQLTVFNSNGQPVCERLLFTYPQDPLNIELSGDSSVFTRHKIALQVATTQQGKLPIATDMSVAVYRLDSLQQFDELDITNYFLLGSDLTGRVESPAWYFNKSNEKAAEAMDNLMLTHGWRRFNWEQVSKTTKPVFRFAPEYGGHMIEGRITKTGTGLPVKDVGASLSVPGLYTQYRNTISDDKGRVQFSMKDFYTTGEIVAQTDNLKDSSLVLEIQSPFSDQFAAGKLPALPAKSVHAAELLQHSTALQVQNEFNGSRLKQFSPLEVDTANFYEKPDAAYQLDNYVRFTTMEEVLREYVMPVNVRRRNGHFFLPVFDELQSQYFSNDPLLLIDGVPVLNADKLMAYDPLKIRKLEVVSRRYFHANIFYEGIVHFVTYKGRLDGYELDPRATVIDYEGLQAQRNFYAPVYETAEQRGNRLPDFRDLLYWSPSLHTTSSGRQAIDFYSSDIPGKYLVVAQGLTAAGQTGTATMLLHVKTPAAATGVQ
jgi:hypothetical protein